jgi:hypothetical protein
MIFLKMLLRNWSRREWLHLIELEIKHNAASALTMELALMLYVFKDFSANLNATDP